MKLYEKMKLGITMVVAITMLLTVIPMTAFAMQVFIDITVDTGNKCITLEVEPTDRIEDIKSKIYDKENIEESRQILAFEGVTLEDGNTLQDYDIQKDSTISLTIKPANAPAGDESGVAVTITNDISKTYDGVAVNEPEYSVVGNGEVTIEYKLLDADDSAYTTERPVNAGKYTVRISIEEQNYNVASATANFEIAKKAVTVTATAPDKVYDGTTDIDESAIVITFVGLITGDTLGCTVKEAWYNGASVGTDKIVPIVFNVTGEAAANYTFPTGGEWMAPDYYVEAVANITEAEQSAPTIDKSKETVSPSIEQGTPQTGDTSNPWLWASLAFICGAMLLGKRKI